MNLKYIMWFVKALSYFSLQRNFQMVILYLPESKVLETKKEQQVFYQYIEEM